MFPGAALILIILALVVPSFFAMTWLISAYHRLSALRKGYLLAYRQLDAVLNGRYELVLALVESAKGWLVQDPGAPEALLAARNAASAARLQAVRAPGDAPPMRNLAETETALATTLRRLLALAKEPPELNIDPAMLRLRAELEASAHSMAASSDAYNEAVMRYNTVRGGFPNNLVALPFGFAPAEPFSVRNPGNTASQASGSLSVSQPKA